MFSKSQALSIIYLAVRDIEAENKPSFKADMPNLLDFIKGKSVGPASTVFEKYPNVYGALNDINNQLLLDCLNELVSKNMLETHYSGGKTLYSTVSANSSSETAQINDILLFSGKANEYQAQIIKAFWNHFTKSWIGITPIEHRSYLGFKLSNFVNTIEFNWFWLSFPRNYPNSLTIRARLTPTSQAIYYEETFKIGQINDVIKKIDAILFKSAVKFKLENLSPKTNSSVKNETQNDQPILDSNNIKSNCFFLQDYCKKGNIVFIKKDDGNFDEVFLTVVENSPFSFTPQTRFAPYKEMKEIQKNTTKFEFSYRKWEIIAWSAPKSNNLFIDDVLLLSKKSKRFWILINLPTHTVKVFTIWNFYTKISDRIISADELKNLII